MPCDERLARTGLRLAPPQSRERSIPTWSRAMQTLPFPAEAGEFQFEVVLGGSSLLPVLSDAHIPLVEAVVPATHALRRLRNSGSICQFAE